jgi:hypothetical protein
MATRLLRLRRALRGVGFRLTGDVIRVWKVRITEIELYCCVPVKTDCLVQSTY